MFHEPRFKEGFDATEGEGRECQAQDASQVLEAVLFKSRLLKLGTGREMMDNHMDTIWILDNIWILILANIRKLILEKYMAAILLSGCYETATPFEVPFFLQLRQNQFESPDPNLSNNQPSKGKDANTSPDIS